MIIGIDASRAFIKKRTGIEEYSYQVIKHLRQDLKDSQVVLYIRKNQEIDFELPENWKIKTIYWPVLWTQIGLSLEMLFNPADVLFIPAHTVPMIHPKNTIVTIHGLEYEFCPEAYSWWEKLYMRWSIKNSCRWAKKIISVSENTKKDLIKLYGVSPEKIEVIYEGYDNNFQFQTLSTSRQVSNFQSNSKLQIQNYKPYLLFIGRLEERKNILGIVKAFEILKEKYSVAHKLILTGKPGYGFDKIQNKIQKSKYLNQITITGFVSDDEKWELLKNADAFLFPTFYEGFGIPILEAQSIEAPVITSNISSMPEIAGESALLVDPNDPKEIAEKAWKLISDKAAKDDIIKKGEENIKRFSWEKCAKDITGELLG